MGALVIDLELFSTLWALVGWPTTGLERKLSSAEIRLEDYAIWVCERVDLVGVLVDQADGR